MKPAPSKKSVRRESPYGTDRLTKTHLNPDVSVWSPDSNAHKPGANITSHGLNTTAEPMPFSAEETGKGAVSGEARRRSVAAHHAEHDDNFAANAKDHPIDSRK